jgi:hypothetical protein
MTIGLGVRRIFDGTQNHERAWRPAVRQDYRDGRRNAAER